MSFQFVHQPFVNGSSMMDYFEEIAQGDFSELDIVSAWAKRSGTSHLNSILHTLAHKGVRIRAVIGISLGGTSQQGLEDLLAITESVYIYQHPGRTFHPKIYRASGENVATTLVGSHNLTAGGLMNNFEAGTIGRLDLGMSTEASYHSSILEYINDLIDDNASRLLSEDLLADLLQNDRYVILDESASVATGDETGTRLRTNGPRLFQRTSHELSNFIPPRIDSSLSAKPSNEPSEPARPMPILHIDMASPQDVAVEARWYKTLGAIDAQHGTSSNYNRSNTATLVQAGHPIDRETYFRDDFFAVLHWEKATTLGSKEREHAPVTVEVITDDRSLGLFDLTVRHTPAYDSEQGNRTTELRWGELAEHMKDTNHTGDYLVLERMSDGTFRLHLTENLPGEFMP